jgi:ParB family chromosome partitioning protein
VKGLAVQSVAVERVQASPHNPRKRFEEGPLRELAESIRTHGVLQPLVVRPLGEGWEVVAGERRWRAAKLAGIGEVPVVVRELNDVQAAEVQILENLQREDIAPMEEAAGFKRLIDLGAYTPDTLAERLGKSRSHVYGRLRLLKVTPEVQEAGAQGLDRGLGGGAAREVPGGGATGGPGGGETRVGGVRRRGVSGSAKRWWRISGRHSRGRRG